MGLINPRRVCTDDLGVERPKKEKDTRKKLQERQVTFQISNHRTTSNKQMHEPLRILYIRLNNPKPSNWLSRFPKV